MAHAHSLNPVPAISRAEAVLLAGLQSRVTNDGDTLLAELTPEEWASVVQLAIRQRVGPLLLHHLLSTKRDHHLPGDARQLLKARARSAAARALRCQAEFVRLSQMVEPHGVSLVALKGLHLASSVYANPALREMIDIDVFVPVGDVVTVAELAGQLGYEPVRQFDLAADLVASHHLPRFMKPHVGLEIHWRLFSPFELLCIDTVGLLLRAVPFQLTSNAKTLCPEDLLLHICIHGSAVHGFAQGLRPMCDVRAIIDRYRESLLWDEVIDRATAWQVRRAVLLVLRLSRDLLGAAVPADVLARLGAPEVPPDLMAVSARQALSGSALAEDVTPAAGRLLACESAGARLCHLWSRVWLSEEVLATLYHFALGLRPRQLALYRARRAYDVLVKYGWRLTRLAWRSDGPARQFIDRRNALAAWLRER